MDGLSPSGLAKWILPKVPMILKTTASHAVGAPTTKAWDLKTEVTIKVIREFMCDPRPISITKLQKMTAHDPGIKGKMWVAKTELPALPENGLRELLKRAMDDLGGSPSVTIPENKSIGAEWTGFRSDGNANSKRPDIAETRHYENMMKDVRSDVTVLFIHGGAMYLLDPVGYRPVCAALAKRTGGRCFSIRYRLAPQNPFPAALLDVLVSYVSLLHPPPGSMHEAVSPKNIVVSGDSAGGNLAAELLQLLLQINRTAKEGETVKFHGKEIPLPLPIPAGVALNSPWCDLNASMPSVNANGKFDYIPSLQEQDRFGNTKPCIAWPANPPRIDLYCDGDQLLHPLVSPLAARNWEGSCPVFFVLGEERLMDEGRALAGVMADQGVPVEWWDFEAMPHVFCVVLPGTPVSHLCYDKWAQFMRRVTGTDYEYKVTKGKAGTLADTVLTTSATHVQLPSLQQTTLSRAEMCPFSLEEINRLLQEGNQRRLKETVYTGPATKAKASSANGAAHVEANGQSRPTKL